MGCRATTAHWAAGRPRLPACASPSSPRPSGTPPRESRHLRRGWQVQADHRVSQQAKRGQSRKPGTPDPRQ
ncbi:hypothetical protein HispidOSU_024186, partial [Sigmodon hispidus]